MEHGFCRSMLALCMEQVKEKTTTLERKKAWAIRTGLGQMEFHGPNGFYWHGQGCCLYTARTKGWIAYLDHLVRSNQL